MNQEDHQENDNKIRQRRASIRGNLKRLLSTDTSQFFFQSQPETFSPQMKKQKQKIAVRVRRKTSQDVRMLGNCWDMFDFNEMITNECFQDYYQKLQKIDQGSQSVVYKCKQRQTDNIFAVKQIKIRDLDIIFSIKQQFRVLKNLNHTHIVKAHSLFIHQKKGVSHMVCEYVPYMTLRQYMNKQKTNIKQVEIAQIANIVLHILAYLHHQGICHRDIKPQNILYDPLKGDLKLIDFQIAKMVKYEHQKLQMSTNTGTLAYKAPQMFKGGFYSSSIDIWAVGVMVYQLATATSPFFSLYQNDTIRKILQDEPNYDLPNVTTSCIQFIQKLLIKDPLYRYSARQALKTPFLLKYSSMSSSASSPRAKKNGSQGKQRQAFEIQFVKCLNEDSKLTNQNSLNHQDRSIKVFKG